MMQSEAFCVLHILYQFDGLCGAGDAFGRPARELRPWEVIAIGALAGAIAAVLTTPGDVMKTRIMTAPVDKVRLVTGLAINIRV